MSVAKGSAGARGPQSKAGGAQSDAGGANSQDGGAPSAGSEQTDPEFERLLQHIREHRGFDFTGYKRSTLQRRVRKRMQELGVRDYQGYLDELEVSAEELNNLFDTILINVSSFFRDRPVWDHVRTALIPELLAGKRRGEPIRAWSAGCATGEEPYTIAMLLADAVGDEDFADRVKVFATDVDEKALEAARQAIYSPGQLTHVPDELRERYFEARGDSQSVVKDLRRAVIFGRNDLMRDAPISRIDLLACRNTLIYFNSDAQRGIMHRLHLALADHGFLILGKSELPLTFNEGFAPESLRLRIFRKVSVARATVVDPVPATPGRGKGDDDDAPTIPSAVLQAFRVSPIAQLVLDADGAVVVGNEPLRTLFGVSDADLGRPLQDLELSYRPVELRSLIGEAQASEQPVKSDAVLWTARDGSEHHLEVVLAALRGGGVQTGTAIAFLDVTRHARLAEQLQRSKHELERAYDDLQSTVEELETTNEELQSTNEELETTNEELRIRTGQLNQANVLVESMMESLGLGVAVLDSDLRVTMWNEHAKRLWGLSLDEVRDKHFLNLDLGLPVKELHDGLRACVTGSSDSEERSVDARDRTGKDILCHVRCSPLRGGRGEVNGAIVLMSAG